MQVPDWLLVEVALLLIGLTKISLTKSGFDQLFVIELPLRLRALAEKKKKKNKGHSPFLGPSSQYKDDFAYVSCCTFFFIGLVGAAKCVPQYTFTFNCLFLVSGTFSLSSPSHIFSTTETERQWPLSGVHTIVRVKSAQDGGGGGRGLHALSLSLYLPSRTKLWCSLPYFSSTP
jgi:hypothetical protein